VEFAGDEALGETGIEIMDESEVEGYLARLVRSSRLITRGNHVPEQGKIYGEVERVSGKMEG